MCLGKEVRVEGKLETTPGEGNVGCGSDSDLGSTLLFPHPGRKGFLCFLPLGRRSLDVGGGTDRLG